MLYCKKSKKCPLICSCDRSAVPLMNLSFTDKSSTCVSVCSVWLGLAEKEIKAVASFANAQISYCKMSVWSCGGTVCTLGMFQGPQDNQLGWLQSRLQLHDGGLNGYMCWSIRNTFEVAQFA